MTNPLSRREKRNFTNQFKKQLEQIVILYQNGKKQADIIAKFNFTKYVLDR